MRLQVRSQAGATWHRSGECSHTEGGGRVAISLPVKASDQSAQAVAHSPRAVALTGIVRHFGRFAALRGISAEFDPGQLYVVLGENGAGKSTLLRIMAGLLAPTSGNIQVLGSENIRDVAPRMGYMGHAPLLYDELSALENLRYFAGLYGLRDDEACRKAIELVGLDPKLTRRVGQYSQGMRQRISLARAIVHDPELLLLDEPFSNVDITSAREMTKLLARMRDAGKTIFVVTHQAALMQPVADESVVIAHGLLEAREQGMPAYLLSPWLQRETSNAEATWKA